MGLRLSVQSASVTELPTTKIVTAGGDLQQYSVTVTATDALLHLDPSGSESAAASFLCNSDALLFDEPNPALLPWERLQLGQVYFSLPRSMLWQPLAAVEGGGSRRQGAKRAKICPVFDAGGNDFNFEKTKAAKSPRSGKSLQRSALRWTRTIMQ